MQLFYTSNIQGHYAYFEEEEARHIVQVLRRKVGDQLHFVDGEGGYYEGEIQETGKKTCVLSILKTIKPYNQRPFRLHLAVAPTKNISRFEWLLEKATEIGIEEVWPIYCKHSERKRIRPERLNKILLAAMKQSLKAYLPRLHPMMSLAEVVTATQDVGQRFIAHCHHPLEQQLFTKYQPRQDVVIMIGPEGDFSQDEVKQSLKAGFQEVSLGNSRLRTETAAMVACHSIALKNSSTKIDD